MGVYLEDLTYKEILPILARTGKLIDTRKIIEIDLVKCEECEWSNGECSVGERYQGGCTFGERRADEHTDKRD